MPVYEYECPKCEMKKDRFYHNLEEAQNAIVKCSKCRRTKMVRILSAFSFQYAPKKPKAYY